MKHTISCFSLAFALFAAAGPGCDRARDVPGRAATSPAKTTAASRGTPEDDFFGSPGGKYTAEDIKANGSETPMQKYKKIGHVDGGDAAPGDKLCPISNDKANPQVTWVIGGKTYAFCCSPCVKSFVKKAKDHPDEVKDPSDYVKK